MKDSPTKTKLPDIKAILHCLPDLYLILDAQLNIIEASNAYLKATKVTRAKAIGHNVFEIFPDNPADKNASGRKNLTDSLQKVLREKVSNAMAVQKYDIKRPAEEGGGFEEHYWSPINVPVLSANNEVVCIIHRVEDVTAFVKMKHSKLEHEKIAAALRTRAGQAEQEIFQRAQEIQEQNKKLAVAYEKLSKSELSNAHLATMVEFSQDGIIGKDLNGIIQSFNKGAEDLYGYKASEVIGQHTSIIFPKDRKQELDMIMAQINKNEAVRLHETERMHKDGRLIPVSVTISPIKDHNGKLIGACSIARDITEWKKIEKMKNEFISIVSHELRTPLTSIQGSLSLLVAGATGKLPESAQKLLTIGKQNSERLIRLINDILDIEKIESGKMEFKFQNVQIDTIVAEALIANQSFAQKYNIKVKVAEGVNAKVHVDRDRLFQVLTNLISNAIKFATPATTVLIKLSQVDDNVKVAITNKGPGIPKDFQSRIFQKFAQADSSATREQPGTGLGLSISKEIIEKLHGSIYFSSDSDETTFYFTLPIVYQPKAVPVKTKTIHFAKVPTILICEHDEDTAKNLQLILEDHSFKTIIVHSATDVRPVLEYQHVDGLLLELNLPDDSIRLIKDIRRTHSMTHLPIIIMSMTAKNEHHLNGDALAVIDWIEKPVDLERLVIAIQSIKKKIALHSPKILHVEDDLDLLKVIGNLLQDEATIKGVTTVAAARKELNKHNYDLIILDLMLPDGSGLDLLPIISKKNIPIIVFSAYELPKDYTQYVFKVMLKSEGSVFKFVETIKNSLAKSPS